MNRIDREIDDLLRDVILLDGEQDDAPSLADMARRAKGVLATRVVGRRDSTEWRRALKSKAKADAKAKSKAKKEARREVREACVARADGVCEACSRWTGESLHLDHFHGRAREESVESCWMLCPRCDSEKTENRPTRIYWLRVFRDHAIRRGYAAQVHKCATLIRLEEAQHPEPRAKETQP